MNNFSFEEIKIADILLLEDANKIQNHTPNVMKDFI